MPGPGADNSQTPAASRTPRTIASGAGSRLINWLATRSESAFRAVPGPESDHSL
jgi:hypothetical protein